MDELTGLQSAFPLNVPYRKRSDTEERAAEVCAIAERLLYEMGHEWHAYNFRDTADGVGFNVQYPGDVGVTWVTSGWVALDSADDHAIATELAAWWDRQFRGLNPPLPCKE